MTENLDHPANPQQLQSAAGGTPADLPGELGSEQVHGQLIRLDNDAMLLPHSAVLDVRSMDDLSVRATHPSWLLGTVGWRGQVVPVLSIEGLMGREVPARMRRSRVIVINSFGKHLDNGLFAVVSQGHPHLMTLNRAALRLVDEEDGSTSASRSCIACRIQIANSQAFIPDLEQIEEILSSTADEASDEPWVPVGERE